MSETLRQAEDLITGWLVGEDAYQFAKNARSLGADPQKSLEHIMEYEIKDKWHRFQLARKEFSEIPDRQLQLRSGQMIMKAAAAARGAVVWNSRLYRTPLRQANHASFGILHQYFDTVNNGVLELPAPGLLDAPFAEAIYPESTTPIEGQYRVITLFQKMTGHAVNYLLEQAETGSMMLPRPGLSSGNGLEAPWKIIQTPQQPE